MKIVYTGEPMPESFNKSLFLAGPTPRVQEVKSWRPEAVKVLESLGYDGVVFLPELRSGEALPDYDAQVGWEHRAFNMSDCVAFWVPRDMATMPAMTTNVEFGWQVCRGKSVFGAPKDAPKNDYLRYFANQEKMAVSDTMEETLKNAMAMLGNGSFRSEGAREVTLQIWNTRAFQLWYQAQRKAGNRLDGAKVEWIHRSNTNPKQIFEWAMRVNVFIASENRNKTNDPLVSRSDISEALLYKKAADILSTEIVITHEFRNAVRNEECRVWELPSGSSHDPAHTPIEVAAQEIREETGLEIGIARMRSHGSRQLAATLSAHHAHLFSAEITAGEIEWVKSQQGVARGTDLGTNPTGERVYTEVRSVRQILKDGLCDWTTIGMILSVLNEGR